MRLSENTVSDHKIKKDQSHVARKSLDTSFVVTADCYGMDTHAGHLVSLEQQENPTSRRLCGRRYPFFFMLSINIMDNMISMTKKSPITWKSWWKRRRNSTLRRRKKRFVALQHDA